MGMSRCYSLMKCLLILFNIIFLCVGGGACAFAAWWLWDGGANEDAASRAAMCALMAWGAALTLGALAALTGAVRGSAALLAAAVALLALTALAEAAAAWWGAAHLPQLRRLLLQRLDHTVRHDYGLIPARTQIIDAIQQGLECCGAGDMRDWQGAAWARTGSSSALDLSVSAPPAFYQVPPSCCQSMEAAACEKARLVPAASGSSGAGGAGGPGGPGGAGGVAGLHGAACGARVLVALSAAAQGPLWGGAALLAAHAAALLLALAMAVHARPAHRRSRFEGFEFHTLSRERDWGEPHLELWTRELAAGRRRRRRGGGVQRSGGAAVEPGRSGRAPISALAGAPQTARHAAPPRDRARTCPINWCPVTSPAPLPPAQARERHGLRPRPLRRRQALHLHQHRVRDVQRRHAGDGGAAGVGPEHVHVVPLLVRGAVPRLVRVRARRRRLARRARLPRRRHHLPTPVRGGSGVPGGERGGVRRVDGGLAGGLVAVVAAGRAGAARHGPDARPQARAARRRPLPGRRAPALRHDRGGGARGAEQRVRDHRVRLVRSRAAGGGFRNGVPARAAGAAAGRACAGEGVRARRRGERRGARRARRARPARPAARLAQARQPRHVHHT